MSVGHEIPVLALPALPFLYPSPLRVIEKVVLRFVDEGPSVLGKDSILELADLAFLHVRHPCLGLKVSVEAVQGTECSLEVLLLLHSRFPCKESVCGLDLKVALCELSCTFLIGKDHF